MSIDNMLNEVSKEITGLYTIVVKDGNSSRRFTFQSHKIGALKKELKKRYGDKIVTRIATAIRKAETKGTLKNFATDDSVDFEISSDGENVKAVFKESVNESDDMSSPYTKVMRICSKSGKKKLVKKFDDKKAAKDFMKMKNSKGKKYFLEDTLDEANIEIKDKNAANITVDGKPYSGGLGSLKADYPKHFAALRAKLKADGKTLANFGGDDPKVDIVAKADGTIVVNYDA